MDDHGSRSGLGTPLQRPQNHGKRLRGPCRHQEAGRRRRPRHAPGRAQGRPTSGPGPPAPGTAAGNTSLRAYPRPRPGPTPALKAPPRGGDPPSSPWSRRPPRPPRPPALGGDARLPSATRQPPRLPAEPSDALCPAAVPHGGRPAPPRLLQARPQPHSRRGPAGLRAKAALLPWPPSRRRRGRGAGLRAQGCGTTGMAPCSPSPQSPRGSSPRQRLPGSAPVSRGHRLGGLSRMPCFFRYLGDIISACFFPPFF